MSLRRRRRTHHSLLILAVTALGLGLLAGPAAADPETPESPEQSRRLGDGSSVVEPGDVDDESDGLIAPGPAGVPYVPFYPDTKYTRLAQGQEDSSGGVSRVASLPRPAGQATMSNLAFKGDYAFQGSYNGLVAYDISDPEDPKVAANVACPGFQGDVSIAGDLLFFSVDQPRSNDSCTSTAVPSSTVGNWEGIRVFDISDPTSPQYVHSVKTRCGSHTHTLVQDAPEDGTVLLYNGSYDTSTTAATCRNPHEQVEIIEIPLDDPTSGGILKEVKLWDEANPAFKAIDRVNGGAATSVTTGCHDLTAYPAKDLLAAACMGDGVLLDISDPGTPS